MLGLLKQLKKFLRSQALAPKYSGMEEKVTIRTDANGEKHVDIVKRNLTPEEAKSAFEEAQETLDDALKSMGRFIDRIWRR